MSSLPEHIVLDILSRLPVKSLLRFRCVCKSWLSSISDQQFIKQHLHMSTIDDNFSRHRIVVSGEVEGKKYSFKSCSLYSILNSLYDDAIELDHPMKEPYMLGRIRGSCNGVLCTSFLQDIIYIWNPSIRQSMRLPNFTCDYSTGDYYMRFPTYGFGYDYSTDDYKVVVVWMFRRNRTSRSFTHSEVNVYSLRSDSWRRIQEFPIIFRHPRHLAGKFVSGALHWLCDGGHCEYSFDMTIIALDLVTETYHEVAQPIYANPHRNLMLGVLGECLCVMANYERHADLWVMKEYGLRDSWTKLATVPYVSPHSNFVFDAPLFASKIGEILLQDDSFSLYNSNDDTFKSPEVLNFVDDCLALESTIYVESLVSLYPMRGNTSD